MEASLRGYSIAVLENAVSDTTSQSGGADAVVRDLRQVSDLVATTPALSQVLTEGTVPVRSRRAVIEDLLKDRIVASALRLVARAVTVEHADGLISVFGELAELAVHYVELGAQQFEAEDPLLGRVRAKKFASGYASAVFEDVPRVEDLEEVEDELFRFSRTVFATDALRSALADSGRPIGDRRALMSSLLDGRASPVTIRLARAAIHGRSRDPVGSLDWMAERAAEARGWRVARVSAARGLDDTERGDLERVLRDLTGAPVELLITEDPRLLGGAIVAVGNLLVDASAQHRLDQLQEQLLGPDRLAWATPGLRESGN
jgi:F0F1-type ATP synthase delta subunit